MTLCTSGSLGSLAPALAAAQGELKDASKSSENPHFKSKYADLAEVAQTLRPILSKHGLSIVQTVGQVFEAKVSVTTMLLHSSGEYIHDTLTMPLGKADPQGVIAAVTYARRTGAAAIVFLAQDDDDGETLVGRGKSATRSKGTPRASAAPEPEPTSPGDVDALKAGFEAVKDKAGLVELAGRFASLPPEAQAQVLPTVKAARERLGL